MKIFALFLLMFVYACHGEGPKETPPYSPPATNEMTALDHLKKAREILRNEEGHLMVMGRSHTEAEKKRYEALLSAGKNLAEMIDNLNLTGSK